MAWRRRAEVCAAGASPAADTTSSRRRRWPSLQRGTGLIAGGIHRARQPWTTQESDGGLTGWEGRGPQQDTHVEHGVRPVAAPCLGWRDSGGDAVVQDPTGHALTDKSMSEGSRGHSQGSRTNPFWLVELSLPCGNHSVLYGAAQRLASMLQSLIPPPRTACFSLHITQFTKA